MAKTNTVKLHRVIRTTPEIGDGSHFAKYAQFGPRPDGTKVNQIIMIKASSKCN